MQRIPLSQPITMKLVHTQDCASQNIKYINKHRPLPKKIEKQKNYKINLIKLGVVDVSHR